MFTPFILFFGLTVATAVIAHWSDNLGKKLGKKRVSLFGLRPRTTATILTVASSWAIMLFTLAALLITVAPLRNALFSYDRERAQAQRDRAQANLQISSARANLTSTQNQFKTANTQLGQAQSDLKRAEQSVVKSREDARKAEESGKKRAEAARKQANQAVKEANAAQKRVVEAQNRVAIARQRFAAAQKREASARKRELDARKGEFAAQSETQSAKRQTQFAQIEARTARKLSEAAARDLNFSLAKLKSAQGQLKTTQSNLKTAKTSLSTAGEKLVGAYRNLLTADRELLATERQLKTLQQQRDAALQIANATSQFVDRDAPIKVNQTFAARIIASNQSPENIAAQLRALVEQGQESFADDEQNSPNFPPDAGLQLFTGQDSSGSSADLQREELLQRLAREIADKQQTTSIRLVALRNFLANESQIEAVFVAVPVAPAFAPGEILASMTIDGAQGDARIFRSLLELTNFGRQKAEERKVNPPQSPDEQNFYAEDTNVRLFAALRRIGASKARLRVNLIADKALSTVEPLQVRFEIESSNLNSPLS